MRLLVYSAFFEVCKTSKKLSTQGVLAQQGQIFRETENSRKRTFLRSFCFCKKNQKVRAACFLGRGRAPTPREMPRSDVIVATATRISAAGGRKAAQRCAASRFAKPHKFPKRNGFILFASTKRTKKHAQRAAPTGANFLLIRKFPKGNGFTFFSLLRKEPKVAEGLRPSRLPENGSKLYRLYFFVTFPAFVPTPVCGATHFFGCFEPLRKGYCSTDARLMFFENGCCTASSHGEMYSKKDSCSLSLLRWELKIVVC